MNTNTNVNVSIQNESNSLCSPQFQYFARELAISVLTSIYCNLCYLTEEQKIFAIADTGCGDGMKSHYDSSLGGIQESKTIPARKTSHESKFPKRQTG